MAVDSSAVRSLSEQVRAGGSPELRLLAAQGLLPVPLSELVSLQVFLAGLDDSEVSPVAIASLRQLEPAKAAVVVTEAEPEVAAGLAEYHRHPEVLERVLQLRHVPRDLLLRLAPELSDELQEILLLRQDAIVEQPEILEALEANPRLSAFARRRISEYRQHLLPSPSTPAPVSPPPAEAAEVIEEPPVAEVVPAADAAAVPPVQEFAEEPAGLSEMQVRQLSTSERMQLSRGAPRNLRQILIRDTNAQIALSVLNNNAIPEGELEQIAANRAVLEEVLDAIGRNSKWMRKYKVVRALVCNPRTPVGLAVRLTGRLAVRDLRSISRDRNVPDAVRSTALRLYRIKLK